MTHFRHGDRIRYATTGDDGFPVVRYGFVGGVTGDSGPVVVMLDGELGGDVVDVATLQPVHISNVTLTLEGSGLLDDPALRQALANMWVAEAESAGLQIAAMHHIGTGIRDSSEGYTIAELSSAGEQYTLRATRCMTVADAVLVQAQIPNRF
jgi:hypothetical protein